MFKEVDVIDADHTIPFGIHITDTGKHGHPVKLLREVDESCKRHSNLPEAVLTVAQETTRHERLKLHCICSRFGGVWYPS